jgi:hypothetical protein
MEGSGYALIWGTILVFIWRGWGKLWKITRVLVSRVRFEPSTSQIRRPLGHYAWFRFMCEGLLQFCTVVNIIIIIYFISIDHYIWYRTDQVISKNNNNTTINTKIYNSNILQWWFLTTVIQPSIQWYTILIYYNDDSWSHSATAYGALVVWGWEFGRGNRSALRKPAPAPLCHHKSHLFKSQWWEASD